jgi:hypothetical protein
MKSLLSFFLFIALYSCQNEGKNSFKGIGELNIGSKFDSISYYKFFTKVNENQYTLNKLEISKEIGIIEDLKVNTKNGKIYSVSFSTGKYSNSSDIDFAMYDVFDETDFSKDNHKEDDKCVFQTYISNDGKLGLERNYFVGLGTGVNFIYYDNEITKEIEAKDDSLKKIQNEKEKIEFMKDMGK